MGKKFYVFSTLANDQAYVNYHSQVGNDIPQETHRVVINGGAGVANDRFLTPMGVVTEVDETDVVELEKNNVFQLHLKGGFLKVQAKSADAEKVAADMNRADKSAPLTPSDYEDAGEGVKVRG